MTHPSFAVDGNDNPLLPKYGVDGLNNYVGVRRSTLYIKEGSRTSTVNVVD